ncbi:hypothetical protein [Pseudomonas kilonensis]|uniref:hypothetical protein n=1 Tax=Pseudomonas kilonensis TaxID=132476 RepID=UPI001181CDCC|nr:hypothetical protein [Pseudomonas kilonensis]
MPELPSHPIEQLTRVLLNKGRPGSRVTFFPSRKNGCSVACGNLMQADYCVHLERRPDVRTYQCRPPTVCRNDLHYKADFLVTLNSGPAMYLKFLPPHDQCCARTRKQQLAVEAMIHDCDLLLGWLAPEDLLSPLVTSNLRYLYHHSFDSSERAARKVRAQVIALPERRATFETLLAGGASPADISHAIFLDELRINLQQHLTPQTMIYGDHDGHL